MVNQNGISANMESISYVELKQKFTNDEDIVALSAGVIDPKYMNRVCFVNRKLIVDTMNVIEGMDKSFLYLFYDKNMEDFNSIIDKCIDETANNEDKRKFSTLVLRFAIIAHCVRKYENVEDLKCFAVVDLNVKIEDGKVIIRKAFV